MKYYLCLTIISLVLTMGCTSDKVEKVDPELISTVWSENIEMKNLFNEYPRPKLKREKWKNLCGEWDYCITEKIDSLPKQYQGKIVVPFAVESNLSGVKKALDEKHLLWYRKEIEIPSNWRNNNIVLNFGAVDWYAKVYVNQILVGDHKGGNTPFSFDITDFLKKGKKQEIIVRVFDPTDKAAQPRGKQKQEPRGIFYTSVSGIWQPVWIEPVSKKHIKRVVCIPDLDNHCFKLTANSSVVNGEQILHVAVIDSSGSEVVKVKGNINKELEIPINNPILWSTDNPHLYTIKLELTTSNGTVVDKVETYSGMRKISVGMDEYGKHRLLLNNKPVFQYGLLDQGWWPDGLLTPPTYDALRFDVDMTIAAGYNTIRKHVKVEPEVFYHYCDKKGVLVWQDMIHGDHYNYKNTQPKKKKHVAKQYEAEMKEMIDHLMNYTCIVMWIPFNEGWGQYDTERIAKWVKKYDPSRICNAASGWVDMGVGDVYDIHRYPGPGKYENPGPNRAFIVGEFGGLGCPVEGHLWNPEMRNWGYLTFKNTEKFKSEYEKLVFQLRYLKEQGMSAAIYTQTTDVEGEVNGIVTYDRKKVKIPLDELKNMHDVLINDDIETRIVLPNSDMEPQEWYYTEQKPDDNWMVKDYLQKGWKKGVGVFGYDHPESQLGMSYYRRKDKTTLCRTKWNSSDIWLRKTFRLNEIPKNPLIMVRHDDTAEIYFNGELIDSLGHRTAHYEHYVIIKLNESQKSTLKEGENLVAIHAYNDLKKGLFFDKANQSVDIAILDLVKE